MDLIVAGHGFVAPPNRPPVCEICGRPFGDGPLDDDIFCSWHGPLDERWQCDDCVNSQQGRAISHPLAAQALYKKFMDENAVRAQLDIVASAIRNLAQIKWIEANDAAGSFRSVDLNLSFRESRPIYLALQQVLRQKLNENASFPA